MTRRKLATLGSWILGFVLLAGLFVYIGDAQRRQLLEFLTPLTLGLWLLLTLGERLLLTESLVQPVAACGGSLRRLEGFWLGWARSFFNQLVPLTGIAVFTTGLKRRSGLGWAEVGALTSLQFFLAVLASSLFGAAVVLLNLPALGPALGPILLACIAGGLASFVLIVGGGHGLKLLPSALRDRLQAAHEALVLIARRRLLVGMLTGLNLSATATRAARVWVLFQCVDAPPSWTIILLLVAISEVGVLVSVTPGGMGLREGALVGTAALAGVDPQTAAAVALVDRLLILASTSAMAGPALWALRRDRQPAGSDE